MKIFAFSADDTGLTVFSSKGDVCDYCEGIDVENGEWVFWNEEGVNLKAEFSEPNKKGLFSVVSGKFDLILFPEGLELSEFLSNVSYVDGDEMFADVNDVRKHLTRIRKMDGYAAI